MRPIPVAIASFASACSAVAQEPHPSADQLAQQGWQLVPPYSKEHRWLLTESERRDTLASAHLFAAAIELEPDHLLALWRLGHAETLLGEDRLTRGLEAEGRAHYERAADALTRAIALDASDPWSVYSRGVARSRLGAHEQALADLARAIDNARARLEASGFDEAIAGIRFRALQWRTDVLMQAGQFDEARQELNAFHTEFSNNTWPLRIALAESYERERDFAGARAELERAVADFPSDFQAYAQLGYLAGLQRDRETATRRLLEALDREQYPGMYTRLWLWMLATAAARPAAEKDLRAFLENPPSSLPEWDAALGRFVLGEGGVEDFLEHARAEEQRRLDAAQPLDDLMCEAWFYAGLRHELDAGDDAPGLEQALAAHARALAFSPLNWKWEWAFARLHFADIAERLGLKPDAGFALSDDSIEIGGASARVLRAEWHAPGAAATAPTVDAYRPGDLLQALVEHADGRRDLLRLVVGTR